ncbi:OLC1v1028676C1 [Oldenlandia corymbosa var. corymbosa]|uniref:OLC1v1028676C1 n=1 Tax=Oldenlandia corymbosa var. corymbosa TaxID=529605 RepID=A0AAV1CCI2_OLDCO|nr:OLC1v1028676C1 [Oldenlandia corymbosa var. corymbosa]
MDFIGKLINILKGIWRAFVRRFGSFRRIASSNNPREVATAKQHPVKAIGWAARDESGVLSPFQFSRRSPGENDVIFKVLYCGICHSDLHSIKNDWGGSNYPMVPGHEVVGVVKQVGKKVKKFKVGDKVGVGCIIGSCHSCEDCKNNLENYCPKMVATYNSTYYDGTPNYGGYSDIMVVNENYAIRWPENLPLDRGAPLLCAGITTYSAMKYYGLDRPGLHIGVVGLGGLGHLAVKFAKAFGAAKVTVISTSPGKKDNAIQGLGADAFLISHDKDQMRASANTMDGIIDTCAGVHDLGTLIGLLKFHCVIVTVGLPQQPLPLPVFPLFNGRKAVAGSAIGGIKETQEMIDFAAEHNITADVEVVPVGYVNTAMDRLAKGDVKFRFVIDVANTVRG